MTARLPDTYWTKDMDYEIAPGGRAQVSWVYELFNAFGRPVDTKLFILEGSSAPGAPRNFKWRLIEAAGKEHPPAPEQ